MVILISDFDGTVTRYDFFDRVRKRWPFPPKDDPWAEALSGRGEKFHPFEHWSEIADQL